jgi:hypothetical protein
MGLARCFIDARQRMHERTYYRAPKLFEFKLFFNSPNSSGGCKKGDQNRRSIKLVELFMQSRSLLLLVLTLLSLAVGKDVIIEQPKKGCRAVDVVAMAFFGKEAAMSACLFKHQHLVDVIAELNTGEPTDAPQKATPLMAAAAKVSTNIYPHSDRFISS